MNKGFTLLEILVSLMILSVALLGFYQGQASVARVTTRSEFMSQALFLAESKMAETEIDLRKKSFVGFQEEEKGEFSEEKLKNFRWKRELEKVDLGCFLPSSLMQGGDAESGTTNPALQYFSMIEKLFENAVRKIKIVVEWEEGEKTRSVSLTQLYVRFQDLPKF